MIPFGMMCVAVTVFVLGHHVLGFVLAVIAYLYEVISTVIYLAKKAKNDRIL